MRINLNNLAPKFLIIYNYILLLIKIENKYCLLFQLILANSLFAQIIWYYQYCDHGQQIQILINYSKMSSQILKQLKIKTSMVKRLKKQYSSYQKQTKTIKAKLEALEAKPDNQDTKLEIKKQKQFLDQSQSVLSNVKQKLIQSFEALATFLNQKQAEQGVDGTEEKKQAEEVLLDVQTFLENIGS